MSSDMETGGEGREKVPTQHCTGSTVAVQSMLVSSCTPGHEFVESFLEKKENKGVFPATVCCSYLEVTGRGLKTECSTGRRQNS